MALQPLVLFAILAPLVVAVPTLINKKVDRTLDISSQLVRENIKLIVENPTQTTVDSYDIIVPASHLSHLAYLSASVELKSHSHPLDIVSIEPSTGLFRVALTSLHSIPANGQSERLSLKFVYTGMQSPFPEEISQTEKQLVNYTANAYFYSPYETRTQNTRVLLPAMGTVESFTKHKNTVHSDRQITYGPYEQIAPLSLAPVILHFENNSPFLVVSNLDRKIEVSPWSGVVRVEDTVEVVHQGAKLHGSFSRYEFQRDPLNGVSAVKALRVRLSKGAHNIFYRDEIGNISTSTIRVRDNQLLVELKPRFPLFGGWKTYYKIGYSLPISDVLHEIDEEDATQIFTIPFIDHMYDHQVINKARVRIYLPEGSSNIKVELPYDMEKHPVTKELTYLDLIGRSVITLAKENLVGEHVQVVEIRYKYSNLWMLQEPTLLALATIVFIIIVTIYIKLDWSLNKQVKQKSV